MTSEELLQECRAMHEAGWAHAAAYVRRHLARAFPGHRSCDDIAQQTLLYFLDGGLERVERPQAFMRLLRLKARALMLDHIRSERLRRTESLEIRTDGDTGSRDNPGLPVRTPEAETRLFLGDVLRLLASAPFPLDRACAVLLRRFFELKAEGRSAARVIAAERGIERFNTVSVQVTRCYKKLLAVPAFVDLMEAFPSLAAEA